VSADELKKLLHAVPFQPFTVHTVSDKAFPVPHPEYGHVTPNGRLMIVSSQHSEAVDILDVPLIARVQLNGNSKAE
jgi:hypothetical protein